MYTRKLYKLGVPLKKAGWVWCALIISLPFVNLPVKNREKAFLLKIEKVLVDLEIDSEAGSNLNKEK